MGNTNKQYILSYPNIKPIPLVECLKKKRFYMIIYYIVEDFYEWIEIFSTVSAEYKLINLHLKTNLLILSLKVKLFYQYVFFQ